MLSSTFSGPKPKPGSWLGTIALGGVMAFVTILWKVTEIAIQERIYDHDAIFLHDLHCISDIFLFVPFLP